LIGIESTFVDVQ